MSTTTASGSIANPAQLDPPHGYRVLAWLGVLVNVLVIPLVLLTILRDSTWRTTNIAVAAGGVLPTAAMGLVACIALLRWRYWGLVLAIVALSLSLAVILPYGIVRFVLLEQGRLTLAIVCPVLLAANVVILVYWCRPVIRSYLR